MLKLSSKSASVVHEARRITSRTNSIPRVILDNSRDSALSLSVSVYHIMYNGFLYASVLDCGCLHFWCSRYLVKNCHKKQFSFADQYGSQVFFHSLFKLGIGFLLAFHHIIALCTNPFADCEANCSGQMCPVLVSKSHLPSFHLYWSAPARHPL
jgi:hypothetical protein